MRLSVVTSLYRSAHYVDDFYRRSVETMQKITPDYEVVFVNDCSPDADLDCALALAAEDPNVVVIDLSRNFGQHRALITGLRAATGDYVFVCDSDLEEMPEWIGEFYQALQDQQADVVYGVQQDKKRGPFYRTGRRVFYWMLNKLSGLQFPVNIVTARLMSRRYLNQMLRFNEREVFLAGIWHMVGFKQVPVSVKKPESSPTTYSYLKLVHIFINAVTAFSTGPLMAIFFSGLVICLFALVFIAFLLYQKLTMDVAEGWSSVMAAVILMTGVNIFFNGVMAIYLAKIFSEVKQRPFTSIRAITAADPVAVRLAVERGPHAMPLHQDAAEGWRAVSLQTAPAEANGHLPARQETGP